MTHRKKIYYMDMSVLESDDKLSPFEFVTREKIISTRDWDCLIFWMDMELALELLSAYERHCFVLNLIEGYSKEEIALKLKVSRQAVLKQVKKARKKIKDFLKGGYETP